MSYRCADVDRRFSPQATGRAGRPRLLMAVTGGRVVYELRGLSCLPLELVAPTRKGIAAKTSPPNRPAGSSR